ncbi:hypothetical protein Neosp_015076 [[Neocosmospora] mangrovei]
MVPNPNNNGPPPEFIEAQRRPRKYKKSRMSNASPCVSDVSVSDASPPGDCFESQTSQFTLSSTTPTAVLSNAEAHSSPDVGNLDPNNGANVEKIAPQNGDAAGVTPDSTASSPVPSQAEAEAAANVNRSDLSNEANVKRVATQTGGVQSNLIPPPPVEVDPLPHPELLPFPAIAPILPPGYFITRSNTRPEGDSPPITFVTITYVTTETAVSIQIFHALSSIVNAIGDMNFWIAH